MQPARFRLAGASRSNRRHSRNTQTVLLIDGTPLPLCCDDSRRANLILALLLPLALLIVPTPAIDYGRSDLEQRTTAPIPAQATSFDLVSIRPSDPKNTGFAVRPDPNNFTMTGASLKFLIEYAYDLHGFQIEGGPTWMTSARFDIIAKTETTSAPAQSQDLESMDDLASLLSGSMDRMVIDQTKLTGSYKFTLKWTRTIPRTRIPIFRDSSPRYRSSSA